MVFLPLCDSIGRVLWEQREIPVGVVTAALGAPVLFFLVVRRSRTV
jgi:ABC-type Fe3+-siderophore transport system permease subunit